MEAQGSLCFAARSMTRAPRQDTGARSEIRDGASYATRSLALVETTETMEWAEIDCTDYILQAIACSMHSSPSPFAHTPCIRKQGRDNHLDRRCPTAKDGRFWPCLTRPTNSAESHCNVLCIVQFNFYSK